MQGKKLTAGVFRILVAAILALLPVGAALAGTTNTQLAVSATVLGSCTVTATPVAFGVYDVALDTPLHSEGTVTIQCSTDTTTAKVALNNGLFNSKVSTCTGNVTTRAMTNGNSALCYELYQDPGHATVWDATTTNDQDVPIVSASQPQTLTVYGKIPAKQTQTLNQGTYNDTVMVTVSW